MTRRILVVEDDRAAARLLEIALRHELGEDASLDVADSLAGGLAALEQPGWAACVLDLGLPDSQGLATLRAVRQRAPTVPVIVLSGDNREDTAIEALRLGAEDFLDKNTAPGPLIARKVGHVVARQRLTEDLRESRDGLQAILDSAADGIVTISEVGIILSFNAAAEALFGWGAADVIGRNVSMLMPADIARHHDGFLHRYLHGGEPRIVGIGREVTGLRRDGTTFPLHLAVSDVAVRGQRVFTGILSDLSDLKNAERRAEERGRLVEAILQGTPDPIFAKDRDGRYLLVNEACCRVFGLSSVSIIGRRDADLKHADAADIITAADCRVLSGEGRVTVEEELPTADGPRTFAVTKGPLPDADGTVIGLVGVARDVTDMLQAQRELKERNRLLALTEEVAHVGHWYLHLDSEHLDWSPEVYRIHGLDPATFTPTAQASLEAYLPESRSAVRTAISGALSGGGEFSVEARLRRADGGVREVLVKGTADLGPDGEMLGLLGIMLDITELREAQSAVVEAGDLLRLSIGALKDAFVLYDADHRMVVCNDAYKAAFGEGVGPGVKFSDVTRRGVASGLLREAIGREEEWLTERERQFTEGGTSEMQVGDRWFLATDLPLPSGHVVGTRVDITALRQAREAAEDANRAKSEFLSRMSHELRTPLNAILGFAELMEVSRKDPLTDRQRGYLGYIRTGGGHLLNLINDVLDLSRIEAGRIGLSIEPVETRPLIDDCLTTARALADAKGVTVVDESSGPGAPVLPWLSVDLTRAKQVLLNLLSNAVKYNRPNGRVTLSAALRDDGRIRLTVSDTGIGIAWERQREVFQPFSRLGQELGEIEGTGIGLTITRRLVEEMNGAIGFSSTPGEGSVFWVDLPVAAGVTAAHTTVQGADVAGPDAGAGVAVLYVEDNPANQLLMHEIFDGLEGFVLTIAANGEDGVAHAIAAPPDIVIMDINLPGMDGFAALAALRAAPETAHVPVIALSADAMSETVTRGRGAGFFDYLTKPIRIGQVMKAMTAALASRAPVGRAPALTE